MPSLHSPNPCIPNLNFGDLLALSTSIFVSSSVSFSAPIPMAWFNHHRNGINESTCVHQSIHPSINQSINQNIMKTYRWKSKFGSVFPGITCLNLIRPNIQDYGIHLICGNDGGQLGHTPKNASQQTRDANYVSAYLLQQESQTWERNGIWILDLEIITFFGVQQQRSMVSSTTKFLCNRDSQFQSTIILVTMKISFLAERRSVAGRVKFMRRN